MKCEIIDNKLVVVPGTPTETWAFNHWLDSLNSWDRIAEHVILPVAEPTPAKTPEEFDDELDAVFGPKVEG